MTHFAIVDWGQDHWSTLAYIETVLCDEGKFVQKANPRMRTHRRNARLLGRLDLASGLPFPGTRLHGGKVAEGHDDWDCVVDMVEADVLRVHSDEVVCFCVLTDLGDRIVAELRKHKRSGGSFSTFTWPPEAAP